MLQCGRMQPKRGTELMTDARKYDESLRVRIHVKNDDTESKGKHTTFFAWLDNISLSVEDGNAMKRSGHRYKVGSDDRFIVLRSGGYRTVGSGSRGGEGIDYAETLALHLGPALVDRLASFAAQEGLFQSVRDPDLAEAAHLLRRAIEKIEKS